MKPFNLAAAEKGAAICTRDGRVAKFIGCYPEAKEADHRIVAGVDGFLYCCTIEGRYFTQRESNLDLFMVPTKYEGYVWICTTTDPKDRSGVHAADPFVYSTESRARESKSDLAKNPNWTLVKIQWEA